MRRITRPRARLMRALPFDAARAARQPARARQRRRGQRRPADGDAARRGDHRRARRPPAAAGRAAVARRPAAARAVASAGSWSCSPCWSSCSRCSPVAGLLIGVGVVAAAALVALSRLLAGWATAIGRSDVVREGGQTPAAVDALPSSPDFALSRARRRLHADARRDRQRGGRALQGRATRLGRSCTRRASPRAARPAPTELDA